MNRKNSVYNNVLTPICFGDDIQYNEIKNIKRLLETDYLTSSRKEYYESTHSKNYNLEDGYIEYIVSKSINGERIGEGNSPIDIIHKERKMGIDVACLSINNSKNKTNEKSIMQKFITSGNNLDNLFLTEKYEKAIYLYKKDYYEKLINGMKKFDIKKIYYLLFISNGNKIYISLFKLNLNKIIKICMKKNYEKSIIIGKFIDEKLGDVKLYKSKKRIEIRFRKKILNNTNTIQIY